MSIALKTLAHALECWAGNQLSCLSLNLFGSSQELPGENATLPNGLGSVIEVLAEPIKDRIRTCSKVSRVTFMTDFTAVTLEQGSEEIRADYVISTIPLGVMKQNHTSLFQPPLPQSKVTGAAMSLARTLGVRVVPLPPGRGD